MFGVTKAGCTACFISMFMASPLAFADIPAKNVIQVNVPKPALVKQIDLGDLPGRWTGIGDMAFRDGTKERMKCRIIYRFQAVQNLLQKIWCRNSNIRLEVKAEIVNHKGKLSGNWDDRIYSMSGKLNGRLRGNQIQANLSGVFFTARLNISIVGNRQTIRLIPNNGQLRFMNIRLARG